VPHRFVTLAPGSSALRRSNAAFCVGLYNNSVAVVASSQSGKSIRQRKLELSAIVLALTAVCPAAAGAGAGYGRLIADGAARAPGAGEASFHHVPPPQQFWLVLTDPARGQIRVSWSISCFNPAHRAHGGAAGQATVAHGRWVKRVRADWIAHPAFCSGTVRGSAVASRVQIHVYAS
jgi:hypothetical protein